MGRRFARRSSSCSRRSIHVVVRPRGRWCGAKRCISASEAQPTDLAIGPFPVFSTTYFRPKPSSAKAPPEKSSSPIPSVQHARRPRAACEIARPRKTNHTTRPCGSRREDRPVLNSWLAAGTARSGRAGLRRGRKAHRAIPRRSGPGLRRSPWDRRSRRKNALPCRGLVRGKRLGTGLG
jgi:hypothetical protein